MNSARALVSSVLPTPVGPRNRNEPIGRLGSCRPARARRTASDTATSASSWPTTRLAQGVLHLQQLLALAFQHLLDRHAGPAADHGGDLLGVDDLGRQRPSACRSRRPRPRPGALQRRDLAVGDLGARCEVAARAGRRPARRAAGPGPRAPGRPSRPCPSRPSSARSSRRTGLEVVELVLQLLQPRPWRPRRSPWSGPRARSSAARCGGRSRPAPRAWSRPPCARGWPASSIRSMALSGRKRSAM